ncbi:MAG TPA: UDP-N-acetylmuramoyl-L-alanyl-D-glutamate--2,6-diaminopimelate ligase [Polyangiaceae bacterium]|jgi:UDP-N-acetylmuramoyl-L-alanyl-D-glutamate--2,6-diaminopimelate ligase
MTVEEGLSLTELAREIPGDVEIVGDSEVRVTGVRHDSRAIEPGDLFVARKGAHADGGKFVLDAISRGAAAVLATRDSGVTTGGHVPCVLVGDVADGLAFSSAAVYGHPAFGMEIVGITGTNGKTTTTYLVRAAIDAALGLPSCGILGTVAHRYRDWVVDAAHTTPEADELARVLAGMRSRGATHAAMEVSSIALAAGRVRAIRFRVAALTNLTQDHLDFHGTMHEYAESKALLFTKCAPAVGVLNVDDAFGVALAPRVRAPIVRVSAKLTTRAGEADIAPRSATMSAHGIDTVLRTPRGDVRVRSRLVGAHNLENIVLAIGIAHALDLDLQRAAAGIGQEPGAPGRLERCDGEEDDVIVAIDYAHTPDALARVLDSVRGVAGRRLWCVFGCGGDRDATKRAPMGEAAARRADAVIVTSDNPRSEDPEAIARPIQRGARSAGMHELDLGAIARGDRGYCVELDRRRAIEAAVVEASPGDVIVIAGKGHENYQIIGAEKRHFDDREEAVRALALRRSREKARAMMPSVPGPTGIT